MWRNAKKRRRRSEGDVEEIQGETRVKARRGREIEGERTENLKAGGGKGVGGIVKRAEKVGREIEDGGMIMRERISQREGRRERIERGVEVE